MVPVGQEFAYWSGNVLIKQEPHPTSPLTGGGALSALELHSRFDV
jgi:hypothetical protein